MQPIFPFQAEYLEYCEECYNAEEIPVPFGVWFKTAYYHDIAHLLPTGEEFTGSLSFIHSI